MKVSDYIVDFVVSLRTKHVFLVTGGAIAHVVHSVGKRKEERGDIEYVCVQHEQAGAMAAEAYSRLHEGIGVMLATSGPGATNLITGLCGSWFDSVPTFFITGQVSTSESGDAAESKPRQVGFQETDIVSMVKETTKFAVRVTDSADIRYCLEKAYYLAKEGRPGPVLVDVPVNIQVAEIDPLALRGFDPHAENFSIATRDSREAVHQKIGTAIELLNAAERPVILLGGGVRLAKAEERALRLIEALGYPVVVSWSGFDLLPHDHPQFVGHIGVYGHRGANFAVQNSDVLLTLGSRLDTRQTGGRVNLFAREAKKIMVEIDQAEITKGRGLKIDLGICADAGEFIDMFLERIPEVKRKNISSWTARARGWREKYEIVPSPSSQEEQSGLDAYWFSKALSRLLPGGATVVVDEGGNLVWTMQSFKVKKGQRIFSTFGNSPMGYALPAALGASFALGKQPVICIDGDGGFQLNIQELQTIAHYRLPIKIFILNNRSMGIIKQFQDLYFKSKYYATNAENGYSAPDFVAIAKAYGIEAFSIAKAEEVESGIQRAISSPGPLLCDVLINERQQLNPKLEFGRPLEDMSPLLSDEEFSENLIVKPIPRDKERGWKNLS